MKMIPLIFILTIIQQIGFTVAYLPQLQQLRKVEYTYGISLVYYIIRIVSLIILSLIYHIIHSPALFWCNNVSILIELYIVYLVWSKTVDNKINWDGKKIDG